MTEQNKNNHVIIFCQFSNCNMNLEMKYNKSLNEYMNNMYHRKFVMFLIQ